MGKKIFNQSFLKQEPLPEESLTTAIDVIKSGVLHRYTLTESDLSYVASLEESFADYLSVPFAVAVSSGGMAIQLALRAVGVQHGDIVLTNAFTLSPVPGAILAVGGTPCLVETNKELTVDFDDLENKIQQTGGKFFLVSHMRGHICDMDRLCDLLGKYDVVLVEDCAHTMGASWKGKASGSFGLASCFSTQTYKHINSGEGGFVVTKEPEISAKCILLSGSYMLYDRHGTAPSEEVFQQLKFQTPNMSCRMDNLRAALLIPQLSDLNENVLRWNKRYNTVAENLEKSACIRFPERVSDEKFVGSSIQFFIEGFDDQKCLKFVEQCLARGVELKWFGAPKPSAYTITHKHWHYLNDDHLPNTDQILSRLFDMRLPLTFSLQDCELLSEIISEEADLISANRN